MVRQTLWYADTIIQLAFLFQPLYGTEAVPITHMYMGVLNSSLKHISIFMTLFVLNDNLTFSSFCSIFCTGTLTEFVMLVSLVGSTFPWTSASAKFSLPLRSTVSSGSLVFSQSVCPSLRSLMIFCSLSLWSTAFLFSMWACYKPNQHDRVGTLIINYYWCHHRMLRSWLVVDPWRVVIGDNTLQSLGVSTFSTHGLCENFWLLLTGTATLMILGLKRFSTVVS